MNNNFTRLNLEEFGVDTAKTWLFLLAQFPKRISLYVEDIVGPDQVDDFGMPSDRYLNAVGTIQWLATEGYLSYSQQVRHESFDDTVLTAKGLNTLLHVTQPELGDQTLATQLQLNLDKPSLLPAMVFSAIAKHN